MNRVILMFAFLLCASIGSAQKLGIESFEYLTKDLIARTKPRNDINGKPCAVIRVGIALKDVVFDGNIIGDAVYNTGEYIVYITDGSRKLTIRHENYLPLTISFADFDIDKVKSSCTYRLTILTGGNAVAKDKSGPNTPIPITVNDVTFNMIKVDGGTFFMGATSDVTDEWDELSVISGMTGQWDNEKPKHQVTLSSYYMAETEVTQALWKTVMGNNPSWFIGDKFPVEQVSWEECQEFISKLNEATNRTFRLPTEAEWEFAARGGNKSGHTTFSGSNSIDDVAWYWQNCGLKTCPVKTKKANELGIFDMTGNVKEWCQDWYGSYDSNAQTNPTGPSNGDLRVCRGGSYKDEEEDCRLSYRIGKDPSRDRDNSTGFRLVLSE